LARAESAGPRNRRRTPAGACVTPIARSVQIRLVAGGMVPRVQRFAIAVFDTMEQAQAYRASAAYKEIVPMRNKSSKYRAFIADGSVGTTGGK
jgi:uncharacterized protein (DUF1330 family)